ncbi:MULTISPECIES: hypothetical protein [Rossellomorea]|nr:hypothetical protein [Rossellomorea aquimaris]
MKNHKQTQHEASKKLAKQQMGEEIELKSVAPAARKSKSTEGK